MGKKEWATANLWSSVATENSGYLSRQEVLVETRSPGRAHNKAWVLGACAIGGAHARQDART